jgi:hypothetical protein
MKTVLDILLLLQSTMKAVLDILLLTVYEDRMLDILLLRSMKTVLDILLLLQSMKTQTVDLVNTRMTAPTTVVEA